MQPYQPEEADAERYFVSLCTCYHPLTSVGGCSDHESGSDDEDLYMAKGSEGLSDTHDERCRYTVARVYARQVDQGFF